MTMKRWGALAATIAMVLGSAAAISAEKQVHTPRGQATVVSAKDVADVVATLGNQKNIDKAVKTIDTNGPAGIISIGAVAYRPGPQDWKGVGNEHSAITEVFHVTKGSATFIFGGDLENAKEFDANNEAVRKVFGPGQGGQVKGYREVTAKVGDNVVLPPNTPHNVIKVTEDFEMIVIRIDPKRVLELDSAGRPPAIAGAGSPNGPWLGKWRKRTDNASANNGPAPTFHMWLEDDGFRYTLDMTPPNGPPIHMSAFGRFDGQRYPEKGNPAADFNVFKRVDDHTYELIDVKDDKDNISFSITISPDGKTRTSTSKSRNAKGEIVTSVGVWDRIE